MSLGAWSTLTTAWIIRVASGDPAVPHWFEQKVNHFTATSATFSQRYYVEDKYFGGPGYPIFVVMGGEGGIPPEVGLFYPWVTHVLSKAHSALVVEPEHRFYGASLPFGNTSFEQERLIDVMNTQQALADAATFILAMQAERNCTARGTAGYCPVLTIGGSYPGFLSAMMRLRYPGIVDMAHAASAPMRFYSQEVGQYDYYTRITQSAERALKGCPAAVLEGFNAMKAFMANATFNEIMEKFSVCPALPAGYGTERDRLADDLFFLAEQTFANLNMWNYPPGNSTGLYATCTTFLQAQVAGKPLEAMATLLGTYTQTLTRAARSGRGFAPRREAAPASCFDLAAKLPAGPGATARCGDWSGCGNGHDGEMWDFQTCTFEVEKIGFSSQSQMFPDEPWTTEWLVDHCRKRFGVIPEPRVLADLWGFSMENLKEQASRIIFTNGMNDGWSVGGLVEELAPQKGLYVINLANGAHHSELSHELHEDDDTPDVIAAHKQIIGIVGVWLKEVRSAGAGPSSALLLPAAASAAVVV